MQYKIVNLRVKNFKCFDHIQFYEFLIEYYKNPSSSFTISYSFAIGFSEPTTQ